MNKEYAPKDPSLPIVLSDDVLQGQIYDPVSALVNYVNALFAQGYAPDTLRDDLVDLYLLDFYQGQVRNGGHSQFIHNSHEHLVTNMERASRAAHMIGLPELAGLVARCAAFCRENPETAAKQDGFENRAPELDGLDRELYGLKFTRDERAAYIAAQPDGLAKVLRQKFELAGLDTLPEAAAREMVRLLPLKTPGFAAWEGLQPVEPLFEQKIAVNYPPGPSEVKDRQIDSEMRSFATRIENVIEDMQEDRRVTELAAMIRAAFDREGLYDLSRYHFHSAVWIATHPDLKLVPRETWQDEIAKIAAASPFAEDVKNVRRLDVLQEEIPNDEQFALARAMAGLRRADGVGPFFVRTEHALRLGRRYRAAHYIKTSEGEAVLCRTRDRVSLHVPRVNPRQQMFFKFLMVFRRWGLMTAERVFKLMKRAPSQFLPGKELGSAPVEAGLPQLFQELHVPEALLLWVPHDQRYIGFSRGVMDELDLQNRRVVWRYKGESEVVVMTASPEGVRFDNQDVDERAVYSSEELKALRARLIR